MRPSLCATLIVVCLAACTEPPPPVADASPNARPELVASLREDLELVRHSSDGGGSVVMAAGPREVEAGGTAGWTFVYTAGAEGIVEGGWLFFQVAPFWQWSTPQTSDPMVPGYTTVSTSAAGVTLDGGTLDLQLLGIQILDRALAAGEQITIVYGVGAGAARVDPFAEERSPFWFAVDGDGDGIRGLLPEPLTVDVVAREAARLILTLPSITRPGAPVELRIAAVDANGNRTTVTDSTVELLWRRLDAPDGSLPDSLPRRVPVDGSGPGRLEFTAPAVGSFAVEAETEARLVGWSNPMVVSPSAADILWGDLHGHSNFSDGTGTPAQYFQYARDVAGLDFVALTDHDHWGIRALSQTPAMWEEIRHEVAALNAPGSFVTVLGYEWTSWIHGHRHVLYFDDDGPVLSSVDPRYETPAQLWEALASEPALTFAHHSAGEPIATNWDYPPDPELEPVTEVVSVHGSSEAADGPPAVRGAIAGNFVRDVLERGYRLGFIGSGDGHDGHPGLASLANPSGGLAAVFGADLTREGLREALKARRTYATNGPRIVLATLLGGAPMGSTLAPDRDSMLSIDVTGTAPLAQLEVVRVGEAIETHDLGGSIQTHLELRLPPLAHGDVIYVRVLQFDGGAAWSSPYFVDRAAQAGTGPRTGE